jgi:hypothetical protein
MEAQCFREMAATWVGNPMVEVVAHDEDNQLNKIVHEVGWNILEMLDRNHVVKHFDQHYIGSPSSRPRRRDAGTRTWRNLDRG